MELLLLFFNSFIIGFSGAMMPGPLLAVGIAETPRSGWKTGPIISVGHAIAEIAVVVILAFGVAFIADNPIITRSIAVIGGIALLLMGGMMLFDLIKSRINYQSGDAHILSKSKLTAKGITTTLVNPYWFIWWVTIGMALIVKSQAFGIIGPIVFYFGHILSDFVWYTIVSILVWSGKKLILGKGFKFLISICAVFLLYLGIVFIRDGILNHIQISQ